MRTRWGGAELVLSTRAPGWRAKPQDTVAVQPPHPGPLAAELERFEVAPLGARIGTVRRTTREG